MPADYSVRVTKDHLSFCSGHFITYEGHSCERLHGHNYQVEVVVAGPLDDNHYVVDFIALKRLTRKICEELDHRMMLPTQSRLIRVETISDQINVSFENRRWSFPKDDCVLLPIENTTAELLARYIAGRLTASLRDECRYTPLTLSVEVEESPGQSAKFTQS